MRAVLKKENTVVQDAVIVSETTNTAVATAPAPTPAPVASQPPVTTTPAQAVQQASTPVAAKPAFVTQPVAPTVVTQAPSMPPGFKPAETPVEPESDKEPAALALPKDVAPVAGEFNESDIRFPRLQIVQGNGELAANFGVGTLLYMNEILFPVPDPNKPVQTLRFIPIILFKQYREKKPLNKDDLPRIVNTAQEVRAAGGTLEKIGDEPATWGPSGVNYLVLEKPEGVDHAGFGLTIEGKQYGVARYFASGGAYEAFTQKLYNATNFFLRENGEALLWKKVWSFKIVRKNWGHVILVPEISSKEDTGTELRKFCTEVFNMAKSQTPTE